MSQLFISKIRQKGMDNKKKRGMIRHQAKGESDRIISEIRTVSTLFLLNKVIGQIKRKLYIPCLPIYSFITTTTTTNTYIDSTYHVPGTVLGASCVLTYFILITPP